MFWAIVRRLECKPDVVAKTQEKIYSKKHLSNSRYGLLKKENIFFAVIYRFYFQIITT